MDINFLNHPDQFPLADKYFGNYLRMLVEAFKVDQFEGRFILAASYTEMLEDRLQRIEELGLTQDIVNEIGKHTNPVDLDKRLMDAWAEIRALDQLRLEGFTDIQKVTDIADFTARRNGQEYAFQVTHINPKLSETDVFDASIGDLHKLFDNPLWKHFRSQLSKKNSKFKKWNKLETIKCIVVVTNDETLQDPMVRHFTCQQIRNLIFDPSFGTLNFDELLWFPDLGHGAWFYIGKSSERTRCFADWKDFPSGNSMFMEDIILRREVDLESPIPRWLVSIEEVFETFAVILESRFSSDIYTTEDSVRYAFFLALLSFDVWRQIDVILESPHPSITGAEIDTVVLARSGYSSMGFEFKYDRARPSGKNQRRTHNAGALFKDIFRLARIPTSDVQRKYFVYLTDNEMKTYLEKPSNGLSRFFELPVGQEFFVDNIFIKARPKTFISALNNLQSNCRLICVFSKNLIRNHTLRVYEVSN